MVRTVTRMVNIINKMIRMVIRRVRMGRIVTVTYMQRRVRIVNRMGHIVTRMGMMATMIVRRHSNFIQETFKNIKRHFFKYL